MSGCNFWVLNSSFFQNSFHLKACWSCKVLILNNFILDIQIKLFFIMFLFQIEITRFPTISRKRLVLPQNRNLVSTFKFYWKKSSQNQKICKNSCDCNKRTQNLKFQTLDCRGSILILLKPNIVYHKDPL